MICCVSSIVTTLVTSTVTQLPVRSSVSNVSTTAGPAPPTMQPPQPATPPTSKKEGRHSIVIGTDIHHFSTQEYLQRSITQ